ncbi:hypothetical protein J437_LFUL005202 [Ladona fulva]|uniref:C2H2-type domain-containing protein n=1 Tax=Ladona fulva TaxID=123851 RepID=A0A8K0JX95_LADFU|nr:hypothetical protein J437_LFUL005202 [Ladona fulva]
MRHFCSMKGTKMPPVIAEKAAVIQKICPLPSELSFITKNIPCPEEGCKGTFLNSSNLEMHLSKRHRKRSDSNNKKDAVNKTNCQYHCPVEKCLYNINSDRYFSHIKYLKQHYLKVHAEKKYLCNRCDKGFSTEAARNVHVRTCGMTFTCSCGCTYFSYEALSTHAKRKNHVFDSNLKLCAKGQAPSKVLPVVNSESVSTISSVNTGISCTSAGRNSLTLIGNTKESPYILLNTMGKSIAGLPLNVQPLGTLLPASSPAPKPPGIEIGVQTERSFGCRRSSGGSLVNRRLIPKSARSNTSAGTQTQGNNILKRAMRAAQIPVSEAEGKHMKNQSVGESGRLPGTGGRKRKKSMETQTVVSSGESNSIQSTRSVSLQEKRLIENVYSANQNGEGCNAANLNFAQLPTQNSYQVPVTVPWIAVYPKCNSGTQTNPLSTKAICHPGVTQTDLSGIFLQESLNNCQNQSIQCFTQLPDFEKSDSVSPGNITDDTNTSMLNVAGMMTNINFNSFSDNDFAISNFDPMLSQEKSNSMEGTDASPEDLTRRSGSPFQDGAVDLVDSLSTACSMETQTEGEMDMYDSTLSHIETQTNNEDFLCCSFDDLPLNDIHTQTCDEMLFSELGFSDIQTQTQEEICLWQSEAAANHLGNLVSIETQTAISGPCPTTYENNSKDLPSNLWMSEMSHIETQTDMDDMRKLILELTKHDIEGD